MQTIEQVKFELVPEKYLKQTDEFAADVKDLTTVDRCTPEGAKRYESFFNKYGTHYIHSVTYGGAMHMSVSVNHTYYQDMTTRDKLGAEMVKLFKYMFLDLCSPHEIPSHFWYHTTCVTGVFGGPTRRWRGIRLSKTFMALLPTKRIPVAMSLRPITDLMAGRHHYESYTKVWLF